MPYKYREESANRVYPYLLEDFNIDSLRYTEIPPIHSNDNILIWLDGFIDKDDEDDQYSISQLRLVIDKIIIFTNPQECLEFINRFQVKMKLFLIVSGELGQNFVPKINHLTQINSIYVFCARKSNHESWATRYTKVKGVFDVITYLCAALECDRHKFEQEQVCKEWINVLLGKFPTFHDFNEQINMKNSKYDDDHQPKEDVQIIIKSAAIPFSNQERCLPIKEIQPCNYIQSSDTVTPFVQYRQQMEFSDAGIWPCITVISGRCNAVFNYLHSVIGTVRYSHTTEECLEHVKNHRDDPHLVVLCNPINVAQLLALVHLRVFKVYIHCSNNLLNEYDKLSERYSNIISVLQYVDSLNRLILWDLSACIVEIGNRYAEENDTELAQIRYDYVYRLHLIGQRNLNNSVELIDYNSLSKLSD